MIKFSEFLKEQKMKTDECSACTDSIKEDAILGKAGEKWVKANTERFKERYGDKYEKLLLDKAKELFGSD